LDIIKSWFRDLIIYRYDPEKIINRDLAQKIEVTSQQKDIRGLLSKIDAVQKAQNRLASNTNLRLFMEDLLIRLVQS
jgi:DNA polymerase-3 subunit delta'